MEHIMWNKIRIKYYNFLHFQPSYENHEAMPPDLLLRRKRHSGLETTADGQTRDEDGPFSASEGPSPACSTMIVQGPSLL